MKPYGKMKFVNLAGDNLPTYFERDFSTSHKNVPLVLNVPEACEQFGGIADDVCVLNGWNEDHTNHVLTVAQHMVDDCGIDPREMSAAERSTYPYAFVPFVNGADARILGLNWFDLEYDRNCFDSVPMCNRSRNKEISWESVKETDEEPLILVMCKKVMFSRGIDTYIKFLNVSKDYFLVMLVSGAIGYVADDGSVMTLTRYLDQQEAQRVYADYEMTPEKLNQMINLTDAYGYNWNMDLIIPICVRYDMKDKTMTVRSPGTIRMPNKGLVIDKMATGRSNAAKDALEEKKRKAEERRKQMEAERAQRRAEAEKAKADEKARQAAKDAALKEMKAEQTRMKRLRDKEEEERKREITTPEGTARSTGAELFLSMLANKK